MRVKSNIDSGIPQAIQRMAIEAVYGPQDCIDEHNAIYQRRRDRIVEVLRKMRPRGRYAEGLALRLGEAARRRHERRLRRPPHRGHRRRRHPRPRLRPQRRRLHPPQRHHSRRPPGRGHAPPRGLARPLAFNATPGAATRPRTSPLMSAACIFARRGIRPPALARCPPETGNRTFGWRQDGCTRRSEHPPHGPGHRHRRREPHAPLDRLRHERRRRHPPQARWRTTGRRPDLHHRRRCRPRNRRQRQHHLRPGALPPPTPSSKPPPPECRSSSASPKASPCWTW